MNIETKFDIGDTAYLGRADWREHRVECPSCKGSGWWTVVAHSGDLGHWQVTCQVCKDYHIWDDTARGRGTVKQSGREAVVSEMTIGSIQVNTHDDRETRYMCVETGIGTGTIWSEEDLFHTRDEAIAHALQEVQDNLPEALKKDDERNDRKLTSELCHMARPTRVQTKKQSGPRGWTAFIQEVCESTGHRTEKAAIQGLAEELMRKL